MDHVGLTENFLEGSVMSASKSLLSVFSSLEDPRKARGVRHPFASIVSLTVLGMLGRIREMEVLVRHYWANANNLPVFYSFGVNRIAIINLAPISPLIFSKMFWDVFFLRRKIK